MAGGSSLPLMAVLFSMAMLRGEGKTVPPPALLGNPDKGSGFSLYHSFIRLSFTSWALEAQCQGLVFNSLYSFLTQNRPIPSIE